MRIACLIAKVTITYSEYLIVISLQCNNGSTNVRDSYVLRAVSVLLRNVTGLLNILQNTRAWLIIASTSCMKRTSNK